MPFDIHTFHSASRLDRAATGRSRRLVAAWLFVVAAMIAVMIVLGGATRLTGSGLSIMEWAPLMGTLPPLTEAEWQRLFGLYQRIPQYGLVNQGFGLAGFKHIFWLEWAHRLWGRLVGCAFLLPMLWFWVTARLERRLLPRLALLFALGGLQGAVGWFMVASGFERDATSVSPHRLVAHLTLALLLYAAIVWTGLATLRPVRVGGPVPIGFRALVAACVGMVGVTIVAGGFVAGLHAGLTYNTFPLMDGRLVPDGYAALDPFVRNLTENIAAVQFDHRALATFTLVLLTATAAMGPRAGLPRILSLCLAGAVAGQYLLGVATLLLVVPAPLAAAHQCGAVLLLTMVLVVLHHVTLRQKMSGRVALSPPVDSPPNRPPGYGKGNRKETCPL